MNKELELERGLLNCCKNLEKEEESLPTIGCLGETFLNIRPRTVRKKRSIISIREYRANELIRCISNQTIKFEKDVYTNILKVTDDVTRIVSGLVKEFFIPIYNHDAWKNILISCGSSGDHFKHYSKRGFFWLDYYHSLSRICLEFDDTSHDLIYDMARDIYIKKYFGITTFRFQDYCGETKHHKSRNKEVQIKIDRSKDFNTVMDYLSKELDEVKKERPLFYEEVTPVWLRAFLAQCGISVDPGTINKYINGPELEAAIQNGYLPDYQKAFL